MLELKNICARYGKREVLHAVDACFAAGTFTCIVGANGSGKSTLLKTALGILDAQQGDVCLDGISLRQMERREIAKRISYLAQERKLPAMTVAELVLHGRFPYLRYPYRYGAKDHAAAQDAMRAMRIDSFSDRLLAELSGGMRQKAYIAMALAQNTDHILLDEPTSSLDIGHALALMRDLRALADAGKTVIAVMHDLPLALGGSDRILALEDGRVVFDGTPEAFVQADIAARLFGVSLCATQEKDGIYYRTEFVKNTTL